MQAAVDLVAPSIVRIETIGGLERVGELLVGTGPTTGLVVAADGHIVTSAFNFAQRPASILVTLADGTRLPARLVATDHSRMLALIKVESATPLAVPIAAPAGEIKVGQWAIAAGRTYDGEAPAVSAGIVSALGRIWGKAIQTDAKVSPANYGGPLVDIKGRVLGVLVPLSPQGASEAAGVEWYDSGIGFAVPLEHLESVLPRLIAGEDLRPGVMGVELKRGNPFADPAEVAACRPNSPAYKAGLKQGDTIVEIDGRGIIRQTQVRENVAGRYAGDVLTVAVVRDGQRLEAQVELVAKLLPYDQPFLGILPVRVADAAAATGVEVRYVYAGSPAAEAGLVAGDRIVACEEKPIQTRQQLDEALAALEVGGQVRLEIERAGERQSVQATLARLPEEIPADLPPAPAELPAVADAADPAAAPASIEIKVPEFPNVCNAWLPAGYDPAQPHGLVVWLHPAGGFSEEELLALWRPACDERGLILVAPQAADPRLWTVADRAYLAKLIPQIQAEYPIQPERIVLHGHQAGGSLAYVLAFANLDLARGVAAVEARPAATPPETEPLRRLAFFATASDGGAIPRDQMDAGIKRLRELKHPVTLRDLGPTSRYLTADEVAELARWVDTLDRL